jgi:3'-phosphoadenosine 5'-phosphosulfate sulfotransferase (PAPS reductase)/FAD synthetase
MSRTVVWFSCGAASAVAGMLALRNYPDAVFAYCDTGAEDPDSRRFLSDVERWLGVKVNVLQSSDYSDTWDVWERRKYLAGTAGAPCTRELKVKPRLSFQRPDDLHVFGYTADASDVTRAERFRTQFSDMEIETPLIDAELDKAACLAIIEREGIAPPKLYGLGFHNNNCMPCVKATSPDYWSLVRKERPLEFSRMVELSRRLGARLTRIGNKRVFIDEIPLDWPTTNPIVPSCDFVCASRTQKKPEKPQ